MTLHRWRKAPPGSRRGLVATREAGQPYRMRRGGDRIAELQLENSRLRRLGTDLLLEKNKLDQAALRLSKTGERKTELLSELALNSLGSQRNLEPPQQIP